MADECKMYICFFFAASLLFWGCIFVGLAAGLVLFTVLFIVRV